MPRPERGPLRNRRIGAERKVPRSSGPPAPRLALLSREPPGDLGDGSFHLGRHRRAEVELPRDDPDDDEAPRELPQGAGELDSLGDAGAVGRRPRDGRREASREGVELENRAGRVAGDDGVDDHHVVLRAPERDEAGRVARVLVEDERRRGDEAANRLPARRVVPAKVVPDPDDDARHARSVSQSLSILTLRACVAQEMHGS